MGKAYFQLSNELLADLLCLPDGTEVSFVSAGMLANSFQVNIEHAELPDNDTAIEIFPALERITQTAVHMKDWGVKPEDQDGN